MVKKKVEQQEQSDERIKYKIMKLLIIVPAYNEGENIIRVVEELVSHYPQYDYVVVNDGSLDDTAAKCRQKNYKMVDLPINIGLSGAFRAGMKYAAYNDYDYAIQLDGDGQHNPGFIAGMLALAQAEDVDLVLGSRFVQEKKPFSPRMIGNTLLGICIRLTTGKKIHDSTSGMRLYNRRMIQKLAVSIDCGPEPDTVAYLIRCGAKVDEYQVQMNERIAGESYLNFTQSIKYMFRMCTSILIMQWFRKKGI